MKIAILGALGFLGDNLSQHLLTEGHDVTGFVLNLPERRMEGMRYELISNLLESYIPAMDRDFDVSINLAARRSTKKNRISLEEVREYTFRIPREFFLKTASSKSLVINASTYIQNFEGVVGNTVDSYGAAKQELSKFLELNSQGNPFRALDLFLFTAYGRRDRQNHLVPTLIEGAFSGARIDLSPGHQLMNLIHIQDVVENLTRVLTFNSPKRYVKHNLWDEYYYSVRELVSIIEEVTERRIDCNWGALKYAGHEMLEPWPVPMELLPGFKLSIPLREGIRDLWSMKF
jgi:nucleoside-diphosphate-sugar epimerase